MDRLVNDPREAAPGSFQWDAKASTAPLVFTKYTLDPKTLQYDETVLAYGYEGPAVGTGRLVRVAGSSPTIALESIEPPRDNAPLFQLDTRLGIVTVDIYYHAANGTMIRLTRRIALSK